MKLVDALPTEGSYVMVFVAGTGWTFVNAGPLLGPGEGLTAPAAPSAKKKKPSKKSPTRRRTV